MGSFATSAHLRHRERSTRRALDHTQDLLISALAKEGWLVEADAQLAQRRIVLRAAKGWVSLFDEADELESLTQRLSKHLEAWALWVRITDSVRLDLRAFDQGRPAGRISRRSTSTKVTGDLQAAQAWVRPTAARGLRAALGSRCALVEEPALKVASLLGLSPPTTIANTFHDLADEAGSLVLGFRKAGTRAPQLHSGPANIVGGLYGVGGPVGAAGWRVQQHIGLRNDGGPTRGLELVLSGDAVEQKLVRPIAMKVQHQLREVARLPFEATRIAGKPAFRARLPALDVPAKREGSFSSVQRQLEASQASQLELFFLLELKKQGAAALTCAVHFEEKTLAPVTGRAVLEVAAACPMPEERNMPW